MGITREEQLLKSVATGVASYIKPITREEQYLSYIGGGSSVLPAQPITRKEVLLDTIAKNGIGSGGGGGVTINNQDKTITENGTYTADSGYTGLGTVTVDVASSGGNFSKCTSGTITPLDHIFEIEHGLGEIPKMFMWFIDFNNSMTGQIMGSSYSISSNEQAYDTADVSSYKPHSTRMVFIFKDGNFYSLNMPSLSDWGYFTKDSMANLNAYTKISIDETRFKSGSRNADTSITLSIIPHDINGNVTVYWYAFGG